MKQERHAPRTDAQAFFTMLLAIRTLAQVSLPPRGAYFGSSLFASRNLVTHAGRDRRTVPSCEKVVDFLDFDG